MSFVVDQRLLVQAVPEGVHEVCRRIHDAGHGVWCVGGAIRDAIMAQMAGTNQVPTGDWDLASSATPDQVMRIFRKVIPSGIQHGTVTVLWKDQKIEVTTLRGERGYVDGRRPTEVVFIDSITNDLARRDFTVNAIAFDPIHESLVDPHGGIRDIGARCIRAVGIPSERFAEDGLRVLRAARFCATLGMRLDASTLGAIRSSLDSYRKVSAERIRDEWTKALAAKVPSYAFRVMQDNGLLQVTAPELAATLDCPQNRHHRYDVWEHTLKTLDGIPTGSVTLRLAALLHDVGKPPTRALSLHDGDNTFHGHEIVGAEIASALLRRLRFSNDVCDQVTTYVRHHIVVYQSKCTDAAVRRWINRVGAGRYQDMLTLARADILAKGIDAPEQLAALSELASRVGSILAAKHALTLGELRISGGVLIGALNLTPGPVVGALLRALLNDVLENPALNERDRLLARASELLQSME